MELNYYVLGKKNNQMLINYIEKYYNKLINNIKDLIMVWFLSEELEKLLNLWIKNREFILNPDQSSIINLVYQELVLKSPQNLSNIEIYKIIFKKEIDLYLSWKFGQLIMNKWKSIFWTNIKLTIEDNNPYNWVEAHPDHKSTWWVIWWWEKTESDWLDVYDKSFKLLKKVDEWIYDELNYIIRKIVPLGTAKWLHNSASYKECIGHLYMWYTIDSWNPEINNLEAIIHESSHNKINLIMQFDKILLNDKQEKYYSAIRPDARHMQWVFLWAHAFAPTMYIIMKAYKEWLIWPDVHWFEKIVLYYIKTKFLQKVLKKYWIFTDLWKEVLEEIDYVITLMDKLFRELNPSSEIIKRAKERQEEHFRNVNLNYSNLEY